MAAWQMLFALPAPRMAANLNQERFNGFNEETGTSHVGGPVRRYWRRGAGHEPGVGAPGVPEPTSPGPPGPAGHRHEQPGKQRV